MLHGYPADYDSPTHTLTFISVKPDDQDKSKHKETQFPITIEKLLAEGIAAEALCKKSGMLCHRLLQVLAPQNSV